MRDTMTTLTIRNVPARTVSALKALAKHRNTSMEQEVRELLEQIEAGWQGQPRRPSAREIDDWISAGRE